MFMSGDFIKQNCVDKCPLECHSSQLNINSIRPFYYPSRGDIQRVLDDPNLQVRIDLIKQNNSLDFHPSHLERNLVKFSIGYESPLSAIGVEERAKISLDELVATLGDHLHLLLGMSLLSFVELVELAVTVSAHACRGSVEKEEEDDDKISSNGCHKTTKEDQESTSRPPSDIRSNQDHLVMYSSFYLYIHNASE